MMRHVILFSVTFVVGAIVALAARAAWHEPHTEVTAQAAAEHTALVHNPLTPAADHVEHDMPPAKASPDAHTTHAPAKATTTSNAANGPVNDVCAICGMKVDPNLPTAEYQGKTIGFGCRMCPAKFKANPDKYGPFYLRNEVIKN